MRDGRMNIRETNIAYSIVDIMFVSFWKNFLIRYWDRYMTEEFEINMIGERYYINRRENTYTHIHTRSHAKPISPLWAFQSQSKLYNTFFFFFLVNLSVVNSQVIEQGSIYVMKVDDEEIKRIIYVYFASRNFMFNRFSSSIWQISPRSRDFRGSHRVSGSLIKIHLRIIKMSNLAKILLRFRRPRWKVLLFFFIWIMEWRKPSNPLTHSSSKMMETKIGFTFNYVPQANNLSE